MESVATGPWVSRRARAQLCLTGAPTVLVATRPARRGVEAPGSVQAWVGAVRPRFLPISSAWAFRFPAPFFQDCTSEHTLDELNIEILRNKLYKVTFCGRRVLPRCDVRHSQRPAAPAVTARSVPGTRVCQLRPPATPHSALSPPLCSDPARVAWVDGQGRGAKRTIFKAAALTATPKVSPAPPDVKCHHRPNREPPV